VRRSFAPVRAAVGTTRSRFVWCSGVGEATTIVEEDLTSRTGLAMREEMEGTNTQGRLDGDGSTVGWARVATIGREAGRWAPDSGERTH
jgi:hypothetical protein